MFINMDAQTIQIGRSVKQAIISSGSSIRAVAIAAGLPETTFKSRLAGTTSFRTSELFRAADHLGLKASELIRAAEEVKSQ